MSNDSNAIEPKVNGSAAKGKTKKRVLVIIVVILVILGSVVSYVDIFRAPTSKPTVMSASQVDNDMGGQWNKSKPWIQTFNGSSTINLIQVNFSSKNGTFFVVLDLLSNSTEANFEYSAWNATMAGIIRGNIQGYNYVYLNSIYIVSEYNSYVIIIHNLSDKTFFTYADALRLMTTQISDM